MAFSGGGPYTPIHGQRCGLNQRARWRQPILHRPIFERRAPTRRVMGVKLLIDQHGEDAPIFAAMQADKCL
ncbi:MAG: hypothetical protein O6948_11840, partial [Deltaproteobacteria bacterium]|nr:hypothetical protein [Deltaproteobacteria bacterium]